VAVSTERINTKNVFVPRQPLPHNQRENCPFCPGHEHLTPPPLCTYERDGAWIARVVPNTHPAFEGDRPFVVDHRGPVFTEAPASGTHEVVVFGPDHDLPWSAYDDDQAALVFEAIRDRAEVHQQTPGLRYSQAIVNAGREAGSTIEHPHGQMLGIPFVPRELVDEQGSFTRFAGGCLLCTATASEERVGYRIVDSAAHAVVLAPYWSGTPYEMLVVPRSHEAHLHRASDSDLASVGQAVRDALAALRERLGEVAYNVVVHSAPYRATAPYHWHVHVLPKLTTRAGFELGTGVYINVVPPESAAEELAEGLGRVIAARANHSGADVAS
jgi:UDPglucose--hexose-1-phosphate uridylyltransferase